MLLKAQDPKAPLRFDAFLAGGVADALINGELSPVNDANNEFQATLDAANAATTGAFWYI
jgi:hypothetical protein